MGSAALDVPARRGGEAAVDFGSERFQTDPWPVYRELRRADPVHWIAANRMFFVLKYEDVARALTDERLATDFPVRASRRIFGSTMLDADGAGHRALRQGFGVLFSANAVGGFGARIIAEAVEATLAPLAAGENVDFAQNIAARLPYETQAHADAHLGQCTRRSSDTRRQTGRIINPDVGIGLHRMHVLRPGPSILLP